MEQKYVRDSIADDIRVDGRRRTELRDFSVRLSVNPQARGSAQVRLGETCAMCYLYSEVTDRDHDAARDGLSFSARVIASSDDVSAAAGRASAKAAGVVVDDAAVTPRYVDGFSPARELPVIKQIAIAGF